MEGMASLRFQALGGECELYSVAPGRPLEEAREWILGLHARLTRFDPASELSRFNDGAGRWMDVSPDLEALLRAALDAYAESGGLVHAGILPALLGAGYRRSFTDASFSDSPSAGVAAAALEPLPSILEVRGRSAKLKPGAAIDLGGLAKGWIADRAVERLGPNSLANCAGDLRAFGGGPTGDGWPVAFGGKTLLLDDHGAATSGTTRRRWGAGLHHIIDPRTGAPARSDLSEVSVLAPTSLQAEILAKTALLLGSERAPRALEGRASAWALT